MPRRTAQQYDTLLRIRKRQEDLRAQALAETNRQIAARRQQRTQLDAERRTWLFEAGARAQRVFRAPEVAPVYRYERHLAHCITSTDASLRQLEATAAERRGELENAMKQRRVIERLRERLLEARRAAVLKEVQKRTDEAATNRAARGQRGQGGLEQR